MPNVPPDSPSNQPPAINVSLGANAISAGGASESPVGESVSLEVADQAMLRSELLELITQFRDEVQFRNVFRGLALAHVGAIGCCHAIRDADGDWDVNPKHSTGRVPRRSDFLTLLANRCDQTVTRKTVQIEQLPGIDGFQALFAPIFKPHSLPEVLVIIFKDSVRIGKELFRVQIMAEGLQLWLRDHSVVKSSWKMASLAAMVELVSEIEACDDRAKAAQTAVDHLARHLNCHTVAIGLKQPRMKLTALSGVSDLKRSSETGRLYLQALNESVLRNEPGLWPAKEETQGHLLLAHKQLAMQLQVETVYSLPLKTVDDKLIGACVFTGPDLLTSENRFQRFLSASAPRLASSLDVVTRAEKSRLRRIVASTKEQLAQLRTWATVGLITIALLTLLLPVPYRVRCDCSIQPIERRFAVAPFGGLVEEGVVRPGDTVTAGQVLARMDGRQIRWELAQVNAERQQAITQREVELADRAVAGALLAEFEGERLGAQEDLLNYKRDNLEIKSPISGVVLSGSKDQFESASVETGQVIYEIGPLAPVRMQLEIPSVDRSQVEAGMPVTVWIVGQEGEAISGAITRIYPRSEMRDSKNVFVAECEFENADLLLRPGMEGHARIDAAKRPLGWCLFHKPWGFIKSRLTFW